MASTDGMLQVVRVSAVSVVLSIDRIVVWPVRSACYTISPVATGGSTSLIVDSHAGYTGTIL